MGMEKLRFLLDIKTMKLYKTVVSFKSPFYDLNPTLHNSVFMLVEAHGKQSTYYGMFWG